MHTSQDKRVECVGRVGELVLGYSRRDRTTILAHSSSESPWNLLPPFTLDDTGCACTFLLNPSGGLVAGDHLSLRAMLDAGSHVVISTPSATKIYRSLSKPAEQSVDITVGAGAILEWVPEPTIPFAGSQFHQTIHVRLDPTAGLFLWDTVASGRVARGERWAFTTFRNEIKITTADGKAVLERYQLAPVNGKEDIGLVSQWDYVASIYLVSDAISWDVYRDLKDQLSVMIESVSDVVLAGVSEPPVPGLVIKIVARSAPVLNALLEAIWEAVRAKLWNLPAAVLRRY